jgi:hypothetical protein
VISAFSLVFCCASADAGVIIDVTQVGGNVVFSTNGSLNLTGATSAGGIGSYGLGFIPGGSNWYIASGSGTGVDSYVLSSFAGPFGTSASFFSGPSSSSGNNFFIWGDSGALAQVGVPVGYVSGSSINSGMVFNGATIGGFTMIPGTYLYSLPNDTITLNIGAAAGVPEPGTLSLIGLGLAGFAAIVRRKR